MDFQAWMDSPISTERFKNVIPVTEDVMTGRDVIGEAANTLGGAHFEEDVSEHLDRLGQTHAAQWTFLRSLLMATSRTVVTLGGSVIQTAQNLS